MNKYEWLRAVMASDHTHATKVFAWAVFDRMYGDKTVSFPGSADIEEATGMNRRYFKRYRDALVNDGAWTVVLARTEGGDWDNYEYTLNLAWGGDQESLQVGTTGHQGRDEKSPQVGTRSPTNRRIKAKNKTKKVNVEEVEPVVADAPPVSPNSDIKEDQEIVKVSSTDSIPMTLNEESSSKASDEVGTSGHYPLNKDEWSWLNRVCLDEKVGEEVWAKTRDLMESKPRTSGKPTHEIIYNIFAGLGVSV